MHVYLWEGSGLHGMVQKMSAVGFTLHTHIFLVALVQFCLERSTSWNSELGCCFGRRARVWRHLAGVALSFLGILPFLYYSAVSARASTRSKTGRPAQKGTAFP